MPNRAPAPAPAAAPSWWDPRSTVESRFSDSREAFNFDAPDFLRSEAEGAVKRISRNGARFYFGALGGSGIADVVRFAGGVEINVNNFALPSFRRRSYVADEALIMLRASLSCDVTFKVEGSPAMVFDRPELTLICLPRGLRLTADSQGGVRQQGVNGIFGLSAFADAYRLCADDLPPVLRDAVTDSGAFGRIVSMPLDHRVASLVADTIDSPLEGEMRALQYAGRLSELVAYALSAVHAGAKAERAATHPRGLLGWREVDLAQLAMACLARDYRQPPRLTDLAHELGTNPNKLQSAFKGVFGVTMADYCLERRMREAQQLLLEGKLSVAQVAERVGYAHQSNFAAAFSGHVGMSPREYRRHRAPIDLPLGDP